MQRVEQWAEPRELAVRALEPLAERPDLLRPARDAGALEIARRLTEPALEPPALRLERERARVSLRELLLHVRERRRAGAAREKQSEAHRPQVRLYCLDEDEGAA